MSNVLLFPDIKKEPPDIGKGLFALCRAGAYEAMWLEHLAQTGVTSLFPEDSSCGLRIKLKTPLRIVIKTREEFANHIAHISAS